MGGAAGVASSRHIERMKRCGIYRCVGVLFYTAFYFFRGIPARRPSEPSLSVNLLDVTITDAGCGDIDRGDRQSDVVSSGVVKKSPLVGNAEVDIDIEVHQTDCISINASDKLTVDKMMEDFEGKIVEGSCKEDHES